MSKRLEAAATLALTILGEDDYDEGWAVKDAVVALRAGLGLEVSEEDAARVRWIAPGLFEDDRVAVGLHPDIEWVEAAPNRGPSPWRCRTCGKRGTGTIGDEATDYVCLEEVDG